MLFCHKKHDSEYFVGRSRLKSCFYHTHKARFNRAVASYFLGQEGIKVICLPCLQPLKTLLLFCIFHRRLTVFYFFHNSFKNGLMFEKFIERCTAVPCVTALAALILPAAGSFHMLTFKCRTSHMI